jgi:hypothetical protein
VKRRPEVDPPRACESMGRRRPVGTLQLVEQLRGGAAGAGVAARAGEDRDGGPGVGHAAGRSGSTRQWRRILSWVLLVLACVLAALSVPAVFFRTQLLDTEAYVSTVAPLARNPAIQSAIAARVRNDFVERSDLRRQVEGVLPDRAAFLAPPLTTAVGNLVEGATRSVLGSSAFHKTWDALNRAAHPHVAALLTGRPLGRGVVSSANGEIALDLSQAEARVRSTLAEQGITVFDRVPTGRSRIVLFESTTLARAQWFTSFLCHSAIVLPIVAVLVLAGSIVLAADRRRGLLRAAVGMALTAALVLVAIAVARNSYLANLAPGLSRPAAGAFIDTATAWLRSTLRITFVVASVVAVVVALSRLASVRAWVDDRRAPGGLQAGTFHDVVVGRRRPLQRITAAVGLVVLVVWSEPTPLVAVVVVLVTLAVVGLVGAAARIAAVPAEGG